MFEHTAAISIFPRNFHVIYQEIEAYGKYIFDATLESSELQ